MIHSPFRIRKFGIQLLAAAGLVVTAQAFTPGCGGSRDPVTRETVTKGGRSGTSNSAGAGVEAGGTEASSGGTGGASGGSSSTLSASGGLWTGPVGDCGLPAAGTAGTEKPTGTPGDLTILNWAGYKGAVTYTFDDGNSTQIANYPALQALGVHFTFYLISGKSSATDPIWTQAVQDGHELGNHTKSHYQTAIEADVDAATTFLQQKYGVRAWTMAAPYGDQSYVSVAQTRFLINRGVSNAIIAPNGTANPFNLPCFIPATGASAADLNGQIDTAEAAGGWRVVLVHGFTGGSDGAWQPVDLAEFTASVEHTKSLGTMWIDSMVNVGAYWIGQKTISKITPTTSGSDRVWTWTLPPNFPPGKCLRVTVPGGTLKQLDYVVPWNERGYYEIFLDAGTLTLSP